MRPHRAWLAPLVVLLVLPAGPAQGDPRDDKKRVDAAVATAASILEGATERAQEAAKSLAAANAELPAARDRAAAARGEVAAAEVAANTARREAEAAEKELAAASARHEASARKVDAARERVGTFAESVYKGSDLVSFNLLISARTPVDVAERFGYVERVMSTEKEALDGFVAARRTAKQAENDASLAQRRAEAARLAAEQALAEARAAQAAADAAVAEVTALAGQREEALAVAEQERDASLAKYEEAKAEAERVERELREWEDRQKVSRPGGQTPTVRPGARFLMPVQGWKSSDFGMRYDPYYKVWQLHAGVDIAAGGGQPIYAAADGRVIRAGWNGGYGNYTCISHGRYQGRGLSTCYAHQSRILVSPGQQVRRGQVIGRVGTTGASTGYHLHFEVRLSGTPVQPLKWLPGCLC
ncbi:M23 family metallopeptidase [Phytohabitans sp. ZYX-F-186]|uniref:M23 family metallopeptidase n=1 Tax=Phytohabitans maris TaxID=3071409 RepID=A0ABU0ZCP8_9ACTN|nr:M23 family metallopeptidase [Phytohabitans sp. ZYX-F-186]MDQ7904841.1 M23 family metallopeptidase [Phytohabitans sp. ZYX-F-186]